MTETTVDPPGSTVVLPCGCPARMVRDVGLHQDGCPRGDLSIVHGPPDSPPFRYDDGGRADAGYRGYTGDCACRAIAIVTGRPYAEVYDMIVRWGRTERRSKRKRSRSHPRTGVYATTMTRMLREEFGMEWTSTMSVGSGTLVHVRADELPNTGRHILRLSRHFSAYVEGAVHDTHDPSREGTRAVYGYWTTPNLSLSRGTVQP